MSTIDSMTGVYIQSDFFDNAPTLELFPAPTANKHFRAALLYGKNGSGKSTVAQGFREYKNSVATPTVLLSPRKSGATIPTAAGTPEKFFVFDEEYVTSRVRIEGAGLDAIVLFGEQIDLDAQITQTQTAILAKQTEVDQQVAECTRFTEGADVISPDHWFSLITDAFTNFSTALLGCHNQRLMSMLLSSEGSGDIMGNAHALTTLVVETEHRRGCPCFNRRRTLYLIADSSGIGTGIAAKSCGKHKSCWVSASTAVRASQSGRASFRCEYTALLRIPSIQAVGPCHERWVPAHARPECGCHFLGDVHPLPAVIV